MSTKTTHHEFDILGTVPVGVLVLQADASLLYANDAAHALFGATGETTNLAETLCPIDGGELEEHLNVGHQFEAIVAGPECHRQVMVNVATLQAGDETDFVLSLTDITALKRETERAEFLAHHDPLTRLGNRTLLQSIWDLLEEQLRAGTGEVHAMALDLDRFKEVNDIHGHAMGDMVLRQAANRIRLAVGDAGHVFRFGGDEFFVLVDGVPREEVLAIGRRIVEEMRRPMTVLGHEIAIGCSVGVASGPLDGSNRDALHRAADLALYDVKRAGRGNIACFDPKQEQALLNRRLMQADLVLAIADDRLELEFHPQFDNQSGTIDGAEASIRWTNDRSGRQVTQQELLALAEETGLGQLLDLWTIKAAISQFAARRAGGWDCPHIAVTIGVGTLLRPDTADAVTRTLTEHGLSPGRLEVQIAEISVLSPNDELVAAIQRLSETGVRIVIDGFCSQRPDLGYLRSLGIGRLKFDRKIAERMLGNADAEALVGAVWMLCQKLGIEMSADGVETAEQWERLRGLGRMRAQGAFFRDSGPPPLGSRRPVGDEASA